MKTLTFTFLTLLAFATPASAQLHGINLSGGEFKDVEGGTLIPRPADVQAYYNAGFRLFRFPLKASHFDRSDATAKWIAVANACIALDVPCIFDRHEYKWPAAAEQVAFWVKVRNRLPKSDLIQFDIMNEPKGFNDPVLTSDWDQWARDSRLIIHRLRAAGVTNRIWLEYPGWSGIDRFSHAAKALKRQGNIDDPLRRTGIQAHRYADKDGSGTSTYCDSKKMSSHFGIFARQVHELGMPALVGEAAFGKTKGCEEIATAWLAEMKAGIPNLYGVTWWGGGRAWSPKYFYKISPLPNAYTRRLTGH
ncbi:cellulase family glycosylhydrolase [Novosphingobium sp. 9U]|uniref:cellulase family glycosylhydrolase n=1 Tax=Novosphingobium sp. 9U TaxID=2653158 RepID=UPI001356DA55|nr:cellulase family glycosylhydrolase [Novosphingobium sp. 9U]